MAPGAASPACSRRSPCCSIAATMQRGLPLDAHCRPRLRRRPRGASASPEARIDRSGERRGPALSSTCRLFTLEPGDLHQRHQMSPYVGGSFRGRRPADDPARRDDLLRRPDHRANMPASFVRPAVNLDERMHQLGQTRSVHAPITCCRRRRRSSARRCRACARRPRSCTSPGRGRAVHAVHRGVRSRRDARCRAVGSAIRLRPRRGSSRSMACRCARAAIAYLPARRLRCPSRPRAPRAPP